MLIGCARVSTDDQRLGLQRDALAAAGCEKTFEEKVSAARGPLPAPAELLTFARKGDVVVVWKLDRLGRSLRDLVELVAVRGQGGVELRSLHESIDTTTPAGKLTLHVFEALAEMEAEVLRERTRAGLAAARRRGAKLGRPRALTDDLVEMARTLMANPKLSAAQVADVVDHRRPRESEQAAISSLLSGRGGRSRHATKTGPRSRDQLRVGQREATAKTGAFQMRKWWERSPSRTCQHARVARKIPARNLIPRGLVRREYPLMDISRQVEHAGIAALAPEHRARRNDVGPGVSSIARVGEVLVSIWIGSSSSPRVSSITEDRGNLNRPRSPAC